MFWQEPIFLEGLYILAAIFFWAVFYTKIRFLRDKGEFWHVFTTVGLAAIWFPMLFVIGLYLMFKYFFDHLESKKESKEPGTLKSI